MIDDELLGPPLKQIRKKYACHNCGEPVLVKIAWTGRGNPIVICDQCKKINRFTDPFYCRPLRELTDEETVIKELAKVAIYSFGDRIKADVAKKGSA